MRPITAVCTYTAGTLFLPALRNLASSEAIEEVLILSVQPIPDILPRCSVIDAGPYASRAAFKKVLEKATTDYLLFISGSIPVLMSGTLERFLDAARATSAALVYSDYYDDTGRGPTPHPLIDYQIGSVRDDFDFGSLALVDVSAVRRIVQKYGDIPPVRHAALYDIRLKLSTDCGIHHIVEPLYSVVTHGHGTEAETAHFAYVDPRNQQYQKEMEEVFTDHLKRIGAYLPANRLKKMEEPQDPFPVKASVIIPVKNRVKTIADAVHSAMAQEADFTFNVIVIDNHSTDGTTGVLADIAEKNAAVRHIIPDRTDLGIGGCWNVGIMDESCGRYAVQLDSDDLYENQLVLETIVDTIRDGSYAMVVGSYTIVNEKLEQIPPGLIDHREWTAANGHNNALRINGLGAPRAFSTTAIRRTGFLNVSYGEDYAAVLNISREYEIGRIYESLYLCRRWSGNTDAGLSIEAANRNNVFKDGLRSEEILRRQEAVRASAS